MGAFFSLFFAQPPGTTAREQPPGTTADRRPPVARWTHARAVDATARPPGARHDRRPARNRHAQPPGTTVTTRPRNRATADRPRTTARERYNRTTAGHTTADHMPRTTAREQPRNRRPHDRDHTTVTTRPPESVTTAQPPGAGRRAPGAGGGHPRRPSFKERYPLAHFRPFLFLPNSSVLRLVSLLFVRIRPCRVVVLAACPRFLSHSRRPYSCTRAFYGASFLPAQFLLRCAFYVLRFCSVLGFSVRSDILRAGIDISLGYAILWLRRQPSVSSSAEARRVSPLTCEPILFPLGVWYTTGASDER